MLVWLKTNLRKSNMKIRSIRYSQDIYCLLNSVQWKTFKKILMKSGPSNIVFICNICETHFTGKQPKMFKSDLRQKPHETRSINYVVFLVVFIKHGRIGANQECLKRRKLHDIRSIKYGPDMSCLLN